MLFTNSSVAMMDNYPKTLVIAKHMFLETIYKVKYSDHNQYRLQLYNSLCFRRTVQKKKKRMLLLDLKRCSCKINTFFLLFLFCYISIANVKWSCSRVGQCDEKTTVESRPRKTTVESHPRKTTVESHPRGSVNKLT